MNRAWSARRLVIIAALSWFAVCAVVSESAAAASAVIKVMLDGKERTFTQSPMIYQGATMVPMREMFEALGAKVSFDPKTSLITGTKEQTVVKLTIGSTQAMINDKKVTLTAPAVAVKGYTMVPLRFVGEALGAKVQWDAANSVIRIQSASEEQVTWETLKNLKTIRIGDEAKVRELVRKGVSSLYKKEAAALQPADMKMLESLLEIDRDELYKALGDITVVSMYPVEGSTASEPSWAKNWVYDFAMRYLPSEMAGLASYSVDLTAKDMNLAHAFNTIIASVKTPEATDAMGRILLEHENWEIRYNAAYYLNAMKAGDAGSYMLTSLLEENDERVIGNVMYSLVNWAGSTEENIARIVAEYSSWTADRQSSFIAVAALSNFSAYHSAWVAVIEQIEAEGEQANQMSAAAMKKAFIELGYGLKALFQS